MRCFQDGSNLRKWRFPRNKSIIGDVIVYKTRRSRYVSGVFSCNCIYFIWISAPVRYLSPFDIHRIIFFIDEVRHFYKLVPLVLKRGDERIQRLRGVLGSVVAQDDRAVAEMFVIAHGIDDGVYAVVLPVKGIHILNTWIQLILEALRCMEGNKIYSN